MYKRQRKFQMSSFKYKRRSVSSAAIALAAAALLSFAPAFASNAGMELIPGGMTFGVQLFTKGVLVVGLGELRTEGGSMNPAASAGVEVSDILYEINGEEVNCADEVTRIIENSEGETLVFSIMRSGKRKKFNVTPVMTEDRKYRSGIVVRDRSAGIGTVTFIDPESGMFAGLGHGICDPDTGALMPMRVGRVSGVTVSGVKKGRPGVPGELKGYFNAENKGALIGNTEAGVYGIFEDMPGDLLPALEVAGKDEVRRGDAYIYCAADGRTEEYKIRIVRVSDKRSSSKNFVIELTDERLIAKTGGIVQGMSGSPIIQNGKLIGAVTHVMINDPRQGYGIFIENMLESMPEFAERAA